MPGCGTLLRCHGYAGRRCPAGQLPPGRGLGCVQPRPRVAAALQEALRREAREELGIEVLALRWLGQINDPVEQR